MGKFVLISLVYNNEKNPWALQTRFKNKSMIEHPKGPELVPFHYISNHFFQQLNDYDERRYCFSLPVSLDLMLQRFRGARDGPKGSLVFCCES